MTQGEDTVVSVEARLPLEPTKDNKDSSDANASFRPATDDASTHEPSGTQSPLWRSFHFIFFFIGGTTFIAGTALYYYPEWEQSFVWSGWLYTIGSCGFLLVDVMEFFTFTSNFLLRVNIAMSMIGSTWYVIGSVGFLPEVTVYEACTWIGVWGFIIGSFFIGSSQLWKVYRIFVTNGGLRVFTNLDAVTQVGVELSAGLGGWSFFVGTVMYNHGPLEGSFYEAILAIWVAGSCFFTNGALFLGYRHGIVLWVFDLAN